MDTGSDLVWLPCTPFTCILCEGKYDPKTIANPRPLNLTSATPITCKSRACMSVHSSRSTSNLCAIANCPLEDIETSDCDHFACPNFYFAYADGSFVGKLYNDNLEIPFSSPKLNIQNFTFGCAHTALGEPIGVAGFGRGTLSMTSQLANTFPEIGNHFSYCLVSHSFDQTRVRKQSPLILGRYFSKKESENGEIDDVVSKDMVFTPMLENPKHPYFYCVGLEGISLGRTRIESPQCLKDVDSKGNGGMVVDSGTTFTMLPAKFHENVVAEFRTRVDKVYNRASHIEENTGLSPCYYINDDISVPKLVLHFGGNSSVAMPRKNYFYEFIDGGDDGKRKRKVGCLMLMNGGDEAESSGPAGLLGNYFQQGFEVVYDLEEKKLGFARRKCSSLWDRLK
ncbi:hypothetical protein Leryth_027704 [Lithospermum erythrorhizon]|nr:hypothetical protein Leryth_027704 [Lithospermum erythrorhizon]